ncbi:MAG: hypothetical protein ACM3NQ_21520, partial [Bacteroidales bacterium]
IDHRPSTIDHRLSTIDYRLSTIDHRLSTIDYRPSTIDYRLSTIDYRLLDFRQPHLRGSVIRVSIWGRVGKFAPFTLEVMAGGAGGPAAIFNGACLSGEKGQFSACFPAFRPLSLRAG